MSKQDIVNLVRQDIARIFEAGGKGSKGGSKSKGGSPKDPTEPKSGLDALSAGDISKLVNSDEDDEFQLSVDEEPQVGDDSSESYGPNPVVYPRSASSITNSGWQPDYTNRQTFIDTVKDKYGDEVEFSRVGGTLHALIPDRDKNGQVILNPKTRKPKLKQIARYIPRGTVPGRTSSGPVKRITKDGEGEFAQPLGQDEVDASIATSHKAKRWAPDFSSQEAWEKSFEDQYGSNVRFELDGEGVTTAYVVNPDNNQEYAAAQYNPRHSELQNKMVVMLPTQASPFSSPIYKEYNVDSTPKGEVANAVEKDENLGKLINGILKSNPSYTIDDLSLKRKGDNVIIYGAKGDDDLEYILGSFEKTSGGGWLVSGNPQPDIRGIDDPKKAEDRRLQSIYDSEGTRKLATAIWNGYRNGYDNPESPYGDEVIRSRILENWIPIILRDLVNSPYSAMLMGDDGEVIHPGLLKPRSLSSGDIRSFFRFLSGVYKGDRNITKEYIYQRDVPRTDGFLPYGKEIDDPRGSPFAMPIQLRRLIDTAVQYHNAKDIKLKSVSPDNTGKSGFQRETAKYVLYAFVPSVGVEKAIGFYDPDARTGYIYDTDLETKIPVKLDRDAIGVEPGSPLSDYQDEVRADAERRAGEINSQQAAKKADADERNINSQLAKYKMDLANLKSEIQAAKVEGDEERVATLSSNIAQVQGRIDRTELKIANSMLKTALKNNDVEAISELESKISQLSSKLGVRESLRLEVLDDKAELLERDHNMKTESTPLGKFSTDDSLDSNGGDLGTFDTDDSLDSNGGDLGSFDKDDKLKLRKQVEKAIGHVLQSYGGNEGTFNKHCDLDGNGGDLGSINESDDFDLEEDSLMLASDEDKKRQAKIDSEPELHNLIATKDPDGFNESFYLVSCKSLLENRIQLGNVCSLIDGIDLVGKGFLESIDSWSVLLKDSKSAYDHSSINESIRILSSFNDELRIEQVDAKGVSKIESVMKNKVFQSKYKRMIGLREARKSAVEKPQTFSGTKDSSTYSGVCSAEGSVEDVESGYKEFPKPDNKNGTTVSESYVIGHLQNSGLDTQQDGDKILVKVPNDKMLGRAVEIHSKLAATDPKIGSAKFTESNGEDYMEFSVGEQPTSNLDASTYNYDITPDTGKVSRDPVVKMPGSLEVHKPDKGHIFSS